ncbi:hypothetical protein VSS37_09285 [Candidatus Thiothrix sp. Deng01]|uniref:Apple domain-containing protein n=1 Tax=Candidatus Thiothrix phosphatis TaxID=3112415 RepID=A0ABU6CYJ7_9GAMM|nr:hypothetical protein [Candidatus Thiothrix sp. Deng01]MEB4591169.1 hypothetical protein [Candidatus Thiothrix sp. Deng01]
MSAYINKTVLFLVIALLSAPVMAVDFDYKGFGGWRTYAQDGVTPLPDGSGDRGFAIDPVASLADCKYACGNDPMCQGVEFVDFGDGHNICEIHYDKFAKCDVAGGTTTRAGWDGCWVRKATTCPSQHWGKVTFSLKDKSPVRVDNGYLEIDPLNSSSPVFEVYTDADCRIRFKSEENGMYVKTVGGHLKAEVSYLNDATYYDVAENADTTYSMQDSDSKYWVGFTTLSDVSIYAIEPTKNAADNDFIVKIIEWK